MPDLRRFAAVCVVAGVVAAVGGALFDVLHGGTTLARSIAYALWIVAALALAAMALAGSKRLARLLDLPFIEGWLFLAASMLFTVAGIVVDVLGG